MFSKNESPIAYTRAHLAKDECTDLHKIKPAQISTYAREGLKKPYPTLRSYWQLMVTEGGSIFFMAAALGSLPVVK